jgi:hypothetical protein
MAASAINTLEEMRLMVMERLGEGEAASAERRRFCRTRRAAGREA